jgi:hypothetical protein
MNDTGTHVFLSVGTANAAQDAFVRAVEDRLRAEELIPHTAGRNSFNSAAPLLAVTELMDRCAGAVVLALERSYYPSGVERRGGGANEKPLAEVRLPTPWNQMEAAMAYSRGLPLMVIVESGLKCEGMLEDRYDWHVLSVGLDAASLATPQFNGVLSSWKRKVLARQSRPTPAAAPAAPPDVAQMNIGELLGRLKPSQLWSVLVALGALVVGAFAFGAKLVG